MEMTAKQTQRWKHIDENESNGTELENMKILLIAVSRSKAVKILNNAYAQNQLRGMALH